MSDYESITPGDVLDVYDEDPAAREWWGVGQCDTCGSGPGQLRTACAPCMRMFAAYLRRQIRLADDQIAALKRRLGYPEWRGAQTEADALPQRKPPR